MWLLRVSPTLYICIIVWINRTRKKYPTSGSIVQKGEEMSLNWKLEIYKTKGFTKRNRIDKGKSQGERNSDQKLETDWGSELL